MTDFLTDFLTLVLHEHGVQNPQAAAQKAAQELRKAKLVDPKREHVVSRRVRIYDMRVSGMPVRIIALRMNICEALVKREVAAEIHRRRVA